MGQPHDEPKGPQKIIAVLAFDHDDEGELRSAIEPHQPNSEWQACIDAALLADKHVDVIAWARSALPDEGEFGEPVVIFQRGQAPEMK